jgi:hypothetical protein
MQPFWGNVAALTIAVIYYTWRDLCQGPQRKEQALRERVAYMLWVMATQGVSESREIPRVTV